jgi:hypothetical protein
MGDMSAEKSVRHTRQAAEQHTADAAMATHDREAEDMVSGWTDAVGNGEVRAVYEGWTGGGR